MGASITEKIGTLRRMTAIAIASAVVAGVPFSALAQQTELDILRTLHFQSGKIALGDNLAEIDQTNNFRYLDNGDTQTFLTKVWDNPPGAGEDALGMLIPTDASPLNSEGWAVIVSYDRTGYVSDEEAGKIDYDELMRQMQEAAREVSKDRVQKGQSSIELLGWARKPYYDAQAKKLFWAKRLRFDGGPGETLNYEIRVLGRNGVLDLNVVASMDALPSIDKRVQTILSMVHFNKGNSYAEYDPKVDKAAAYGLAGLIAGGVLAKAGFFKGLIVLLLAFKKIFAVAAIAGLAAIAGAMKKVARLIGRKAKATPVASTPPDDQVPPT